jgi:MerR family copper efflux transcriptional regulator
MNIGQLATASGVTAKMIRHYEEVGLIPRASRTASGYRVYNQQNVYTLRFIRRARDLGFSIKHIEQLLSLWQNRRRPSSTVKALALGHVAELDTKIEQLVAMKRTLEHLVRHCHGDSRPDCPILDELEGVARPGRGPGQG